MRTLTTCLASLVLAGPVFAQQAPSPAASRTMVSAAEVQAMIAKAKADRKDQAIIAQSLIQLAPYNVSLEYRASVGNAAVHETEAELFYVVDGSATLVTGGKLTEEKRTNAENLSGTGIEGGQSRKVAKGDFVMVPEKTPHWFSAIDGTVVLMSLHLPHKPAQ
ncbi:MAG TPA: cupin domain-containing protein [Gammaproteobacteria bacterium]|nr:cupin domain-containing protein [Gammaproteobacteria bacterium]